MVAPWNLTFLKLAYLPSKLRFSSKYWFVWRTSHFRESRVSLYFVKWELLPEGVEWKLHSIILSCVQNLDILFCFRDTFPTLGPHLGEGFELSISHQTENFKPSEVKNVLLQWKVVRRPALFMKNLHTTTASKTSFNLTLEFFNNFTQLINS